MFKLCNNCVSKMDIKCVLSCVQHLTAFLAKPIKLMYHLHIKNTSLKNSLEYFL